MFSFKRVCVCVQVLQEFHQQLFVKKNFMFQRAPDFMFQPSESDTVNQ